MFVRYYAILIVFSLFLSNFYEYYALRDTWKTRFKKSLNSEWMDNYDVEQTVFDDDDDDDLGGKIVVEDAEGEKEQRIIDKSKKRSHVEDVIRNFNDKSNGALIVIDTDGTNHDTSSSKKSNIFPTNKKEKNDGKGYTVVLNNNGNANNEGKKDDIYNDMEGSIDEMDKRFNNYVKHTQKHKRVRVIVITPKNDDNTVGDERDHLPDPDATSLDNLAEVNKDLVVGEMNKGVKEKSEEQLLTDSARKSELEIDIDKLKHVKEKLKLLNEDDVEHKNLTSEYKNDESKREEKIKSLRLTLESTTLDKTAIQEAEHELATLISYSKNNDNSKYEDSLQQETHAKYSSTVSHNNTVTHDEVSQETNELLKMKERLKHLTSENSTIMSNSSREVNVSKVIEDNAHNDTLQKHEIKFLNQQNEKDLDPDATETNHVGIHEESEKTEETNDRKHAILKLDEKSKKRKSGEKFVIKFNDDHKPKPLLPPGNPNPDTENNPELIPGHESITHKKVENNKNVKHGKEPTESSIHRGTIPADHIKTEPVTPLKTLDKRKAEAIIEFLNKDPLESWRYHFNTLKSLDLNSTILRSGLVNAGNIERLKGVMRRALEGKDITLTIIGGSISAGGGLYKDRGNIDGLYYKGVVDWWNKMITPLTGSEMIVNNIAIGSIGTDYFSYCIKSHIYNDTDIVLWELSANDYNRYKMQPTKGARPLERLTRLILELSNKPALLYVNFFKGVDYKATRESCPNFEDQGEDIIAHYYKIPSLSWRAMVCGGLVRHELGYNIENLFSQDQYHPSLRGHAQMSLLLLLHLRHVMRAVLQWTITHNGVLERFEDQYILPEPLFMGPKYPEPLCWTLITADTNERITNTLTVRIIKDDGFKLEYATNFPIRYDKVICWKAERPYAEIALEFHIPENYGPTAVKRRRSEIAITTHTRWGGSSTLWLDDMRERSIVIKEGRANDPGKRTQVDSIANDMPSGTHVLNVRAHEGGFCLAAIMVDGS